MSNTAVINPKRCNYGCGTRIYWDTSSNLIWKYLLNKSTFVKIEITTIPVILKLMYQNPITIINFQNNQTKTKMSNSELVTGPIETVQKKYEILSDIVTEYQGKIHVLNLLLTEIIFLS